MRVLGVDYGKKRVGLAISDGLGLTARPLEVVPRRNAVQRIAQVRDELPFSLVVIGLPTGLSGSEGESAAAARELGREIAEELDVRTVFVDERFTSRMAESALLEAGLKRQARKETIDSVAAAIILQTYLDHAGNPDDVEDVESPDSV